jgi:hypothetical protein
MSQNNGRRFNRASFPQTSNARRGQTGPVEAQGVAAHHFGHGIALQVRCPSPRPFQGHVAAWGSRKNMLPVNHRDMAIQGRCRLEPNPGFDDLSGKLGSTEKICPRLLWPGEYMLLSWRSLKHPTTARRVDNSLLNHYKAVNIVDKEHFHVKSSRYIRDVL